MIAHSDDNFEFHVEYPFPPSGDGNEIAIPGNPLCRRVPDLQSELLPWVVDESDLAFLGKAIAQRVPKLQQWDEIAAIKDLPQKVNESDLAILGQPIGQRVPKLQPWEIAAMKELPKKCMGNCGNERTPKEVYEK